MKPGIYDDIKNEDYHAKDGHYSSSLIKKMVVPALAKHYMDAPQEHRECFRIGTAIHTFILEPSLFNDEFLTGIDNGRRSKADKQAWADWYCEHGADGDAIVERPAAEWNGEFVAQSGKHMVTPEEIEQIKAMAKSVAANKNAMQLLEGGRAEQSIYWEDDNGLKLKVRPDYLNGHAISDLKSCVSVSDHTITRAFANLGYHVSQSMYQDGVNEVTGNWLPFVFIFIEKTPPYLCRVIALDETSQEAAWLKYQELKKRLQECLESDEWPGIDDDLEFGIPDWAF